MVFPYAFLYGQYYIHSVVNYCCKFYYVHVTRFRTDLLPANS